MNRNEYKRQSDKLIDVYLEGRKIGTIESEQGRWRYYVKGNRRHFGELFNSLKECKNSLEAE